MSRKHGLFLHKQANQNGSLASSHEHSWALRRKRKKKSKKNHCFWIRLLRWIVLSHIQKFICTTLDLWWMMEGVKDKTERINKDHELIWIFYTWVDFFFHTVNLSSNVGREAPQAVLEVLFNSRWLKGDVKVLRGKGSLELSRPVWKGHANILLETTKQQSSKNPGASSAPPTLQHTNLAVGFTNIGGCSETPCYGLQMLTAVSRQRQLDITALASAQCFMSGLVLPCRVPMHGIASASSDTHPNNLVIYHNPVIMVKQ